MATDGKVNIRRDSDTILQEAPTNSYAPFEPTYLALLGLGNALPTENEMALTGAATPYLPMKFTISDKDGASLSFTLLINPNSVNHGKTSTIHTAYTRAGYNNQIWGPNQDLITSTGVTAAFMVPIDGLTAIGRRRSASYANLMALMATYRNNGYNFAESQSDIGNLTRIITIIRGVELSYDGQTFMGHFNNFTLDESADRPFLFDYSFEFVVSALSDNYNEVHGHFVRNGAPDSVFMKLTSQVKSAANKTVAADIAQQNAVIDAEIAKLKEQLAEQERLAEQQKQLGGSTNNGG
jgi:hypothetical protein